MTTIKHSGIDTHGGDTHEAEAPNQDKPHPEITVREGDKAERSEGSHEEDDLELGEVTHNDVSHDKGEGNATSQHSGIGEEGGSQGNELRAAVMFNFRAIAYFSLADWINSAAVASSPGVLDVLLGQSDANPFPTPMKNERDGKDNIPSVNDKLRGNKNGVALSPSWSKSKALQLVINSQALVANLKNIDKKLDWHAHVHKHDFIPHRVVFIRPFKFLVLRESEIRKRFEELETYRATIPLPPPIPPPPPPRTLPHPAIDPNWESTGEDAVKSDAEQGIQSLAPLSPKTQHNEEPHTEAGGSNPMPELEFHEGTASLERSISSDQAEDDTYKKEQAIREAQRGALDATSQGSKTQHAMESSNQGEQEDVRAIGHAATMQSSTHNEEPLSSTEDRYDTLSKYVTSSVRSTEEGKYERLLRLLRDQQEAQLRNEVSKYREQTIAEAVREAREEVEAKAKKEAEDTTHAHQKALAEAKAAAEELEKAKRAAEEEAAKLKLSDALKAPIKFKDAVGRKFSFPWHICKTWKGMEELIKQAFLHVAVIGPHVHEGHYDLLGPDGEIILPQVWESMIQPDWAITMHMWPMPEPPPPPGPEAEALALGNTQNALDDMRLLIRFMDEDLKDLFDMRTQINSGTLEKIAFDDLWHLFQYGEEVILHDKDISSLEKPRAARVFKFTGGRNTRAEGGAMVMVRPGKTAASALGPGSWGHAFVVQCWTMTFDGSFFWPEEEVVGIRPYEGEREICSLPVYPPKFDKTGLLQELEERGNIYKHFTQQTSSHRKYLGKNYDGERGEEIDSEVIIDFREAASVRSHNSSTIYSADNPISPHTTPIVHDLRELYVEYPEHSLCEQKGWCIRQFIGPDFALDDLEFSAFLRDSGHTLHAKETIDDSEVAILPDRVPAYVLNRKMWAVLSTNKSNLMEFQATSGPWNDLVLESKQKVIIEALVAKHLHQPSSSNEIDTPFQLGDFVAGKGRSIVLLLHGPPGVGKTSTAECIAAHMKKPLYPLTSGNLPVRANDLEEQLQIHFSLAARWGCILLLDEADVFLQRRRLNELEINAMVSVFLRQLEYYRGILFLTTNRVGDIDPAFKSRIHVSLEYEPLDRRRTKKIYKLHLRRIKEALEMRKTAHGTNFKVKGEEILVWSDQHFKSASKRHRQWNGRQIHNAFQTAVALAEWEARTKPPKLDERGTHETPQLILGKKQFKQVSQVSEGFDQYMTDLMGGRNEADVAAVSAQRYDFRPGKIGDVHAKKHDSSDSEFESDDGDDEESETNAVSSRDESSDSDAKPKKKGKGKSKKHDSSGDGTSDEGRRKKSGGKSGQKMKPDDGSAEEVARIKDKKEKRRKSRSKRKNSTSSSE